jgi:hypothetical protein
MQDEQPTPSQPEGTWEFKPDDAQAGGAQTNTAQPQDGADTITWTASEFIAHDKGMGWFATLGVAAAVLMLVTYLVTNDFVSAGIVLFMIICFGVFAVRKPRTLPYRLDHDGLHIDSKTYHYDQFKSFSLIQEDGIRSIQMMPLRRFMPPISVYMDPADEDKIIDVLVNYLPMEQRQQDMIDRLMRRLRF